jgi:hypothetical protein
MYLEIKLLKANLDLELELALSILLLTPVVLGAKKIIVEEFTITWWSELNKFYVGKIDHYVHVSQQDVQKVLNGEIPLDRQHTQLAGDFGWSMH